MYAGRIAYCPLVNNGEYAGGISKRTDGRTSDADRYITLSAEDAAIVISNKRRIAG